MSRPGRCLAAPPHHSPRRLNPSHRGGPVAPDLSICIPTFERARYLELCLEHLAEVVRCVVNARSAESPVGQPHERLLTWPGERDPGVEQPIAAQRPCARLRCRARANRAVRRERQHGRRSWRYLGVGRHKLDCAQPYHRTTGSTKWRDGLRQCSLASCSLRRPWGCRDPRRHMGVGWYRLDASRDNDRSYGKV